MNAHIFRFLEHDVHVSFNEEEVQITHQKTVGVQNYDGEILYLWSFEA